EISGGMRKRAGLARAMVLDPEILYFDEPSAGLDPLSSRRLDDLILELRDSAGTTIVLVTHELPHLRAGRQCRVSRRGAEDDGRRGPAERAQGLSRPQGPRLPLPRAPPRRYGMSARTHPRVVGAFVLGAIALVVAAVVALSTAHWFEPKNRFVVFFPGSVRGL